MGGLKEAFDPDDKAVQGKKDKISKAVAPKNKTPDGEPQDPKGQPDPMTPGDLPKADKKTPADVVDGQKNYDLVNDDPIKGSQTMTGSPKDQVILNPALNQKGTDRSGQGGIQSGPTAVKS
jgi:hypothetical protein